VHWPACPDNYASNTVGLTLLHPPARMFLVL
jgi:hypothetical protein